MELEQNVKEFLRKCEKKVGDFEHDMFGISMYTMFDEITSPIERIFYTAFQTTIKINLLEDMKIINVEGKEYTYGIELAPQFKIGKYRVDFIGRYCSFPHHITGENKINKKVIIECDSKQFHDRTERDRAYEKMRERYIQSQGFHVFRFTGSEIVKDPFQCAVETISYLTEIPKEALYDPNYLMD